MQTRLGEARRNHRNLVQVNGCGGASFSRRRGT
jgi:hypothetical protein